MTEEEWLDATNPEAMERLLVNTASPRKLRLYAVACCRRIWRLILSEEDRDAVAVAERLADGLATNSERRTAVKRTSPSGQSDRCIAAECALAVDAAQAAVSTADHAALAVGWEQSPFEYELGVWGPAAEQGKDREHAAQTGLLRDIFGNPFRPVTFDPAWRTRTAVSLAGQMYESRDFGAMPILADAIEDAGCASDDVLDHCRGPGPHVRGCWVVDLVLGKE